MTTLTALIAILAVNWATNSHENVLNSRLLRVKA